MSEIKNLIKTEAKEKMKDFVKNINTCMFCTRGREFPFQTRPMSTAHIDSDGAFWFISRKQSHKNAEIAAGSSVQLIYSQPGNAQFMTVFGNAMISLDRDKLEEVWTPFAKAWFELGIDDPDISLIKVVPQEAYYWDTKHGKMVSLLKIATAAMTGIRSDDGVEGKLAI